MSFILCHQIEDDGSDYLFASCEINWKIENCCLAFASNKFSILSPDFMLQGLKSIYWRMTLEFQDESLPEVTDVDMPSPSKAAAAMPSEKHIIEIPPEKDVDMPSPSKTDAAMPPEKGDVDMPSPSKTDAAMPSEKHIIDIPPEKGDIRNPPKNGMVSVYMEMLPTLQAKNIFVNWEMTLTVGNKSFGPHERKDYFEEPNKYGHIGIGTFQKILEELIVLKQDTINIRVHFVAFDKNKCSMRKEEKPFGIRILCEDIKQFKDMEENYFDIKLKVNEQYIKAHRIILCCNERFDTYIKHAIDDVVEISHFDYKTLDAFVNFLYSRDIAYCLEAVSVDMIRCMSHFNCDSLKPYYIPEELPLNTKIQMQKHEFQWYVPDILDHNNFQIRSPPTRFLDTSTIWHLIIAMRASDRDKFIAIFAEITEGDQPKHFCLEFSLLDHKKDMFRRLIINNESYEYLGFENFIKKTDILTPTYKAMRDCVGFQLIIKTSDGNQECSTGCHAMSFILPSKSKYDKQVFVKMLHYCNKEMYSDITILCRKDISKANKFILAARSPFFREMIRIDKEILRLGIESRLLRSILKYMYTGVLQEKGEVIVELLKITENIAIPSLRTECEKYLRERNTCYHKFNRNY